MHWRVKLVSKRVSAGGRTMLVLAMHTWTKSSHLRPTYRTWHVPETMNRISKRLYVTCVCWFIWYCGLHEKACNMFSVSQCVKIQRQMMSDFVKLWFEKPQNISYCELDVWPNPQLTGINDKHSLIPIPYFYYYYYASKDNLHTAAITDYSCC